MWTPSGRFVIAGLASFSNVETAKKILQNKHLLRSFESPAGWSPDGLHWKAFAPVFYIGRRR
jgi:hypothetical protein